MMTVIIFLIVLSFLVIAHEWGHFIVAVKSGMKVYEFGLGFPPRVLGAYKDPKTKKWVFVWGKGKSSLKDAVDGEPSIEEYPTTLYSLNLLPLGGFVKIKGENGESKNDKDSFGSHPYYKKAGVLVAGVVMNVVVAAMLLAIGFTIGLPTNVTNQQDLTDGATIEKGPWVSIEQVKEGSTAKEGGLTFGDKITKVDDLILKNSNEFIAYISQTTSTNVSLVVEREGEALSKEIEVRGKPGETGRIGAAIIDVAHVSYPWYTSILKGITASISILGAIYYSFFVLIKGMIMGSGGAMEVSGPVGIASIVGKSARLGIQYLINVTAMISLSLAAINILPIPALDGGRLVFVTFEKIFKKPVPLKYEQLAHTLGFLLLMALIVWVTFKDITSLI